MNNLSVITYQQRFFLGVLCMFLLACGVENNSESTNDSRSHVEHSKPTNNSDVYLERSNATIKKEQGRSIVYYEGQLFTGVLVFTDETKQAVLTLENIKNGKSLGTHTHHSGNVTIRFITTLSGNKLRVLGKDEEVTATKTTFYDSNTGAIEYEAEGYIKDGDFIEHGKAITYEDGEIVDKETFKHGEQ